jgi:hypothetical protein
VTVSGLVRFRIMRQSRVRVDVPVRWHAGHRSRNRGEDIAVGHTFPLIGESHQCLIDPVEVRAFDGDAQFGTPLSNRPATRMFTEHE